ncbi:MAG: hypothetical protein KAT05_13345, partial [Spirochaetes bacterium]|nr:hypothetical protein [Spirochaetota bacterium]
MFEIFNNKKVRMVLGVLVIFIFLSNTSLAENSIRTTSFNGNAEYISLNGGQTAIHFKAKSVSLITNTTVYYSINNITIQYYSGWTKLINGTSSIQVQYNEKYPQNLENIEMELSLNNISMTKYFDYNWIDIEGSYNYFDIESKGYVYIKNNQVDYVILNDVKITDFSTISFEIDNRSNIMSTYNNRKFKLKANSISDLIIKSDVSKVTLFQANGVFGLNDHKFDIKETDTLEVEIIPNNQTSVFSLEDQIVKFYGFTNLVKLNNRDIMDGDILYWFKEQPEKIMAIAAAFSA